MDFFDYEQGWEEIVVNQDQSSESESEMKILLPAMPSLYICSFLFRACEEVHRIGGHVLDKTIMQRFAKRLLEKVRVCLPQITYGLPSICKLVLFYADCVITRPDKLRTRFYYFVYIQKEKKGIGRTDADTVTPTL